MSVHELPILPQFTTTDHGTDHGTDPVEDLAGEPPHLHCADGWLFEFRNMVEDAPSPAVVGAAVASAQRCLLEAAAETHERYRQLVLAGFFDGAGEHTEIEVLPQPLGDLTDPDGSPVHVDDIG